MRSMIFFSSNYSPLILTPTKCCGLSHSLNHSSPQDLMVLSQATSNMGKSLLFLGCLPFTMIVLDTLIFLGLREHLRWFLLVIHQAAHWILINGATFIYISISDNQFARISFSLHPVAETFQATVGLMSLS